MQTRTYGELIDLIQSLIGAGTMLGDEYLKIANFINRRYSEAYNTSPSWARYIVSSEERTLSSGNVVPYTEGGKDNIGEFIRIHRTQAFQKNSALEYDFYVDSNGANILNITNDNDTSAFVTYKKQLTLFTVAVSDPVVAADFIDGGTVNGAANRALSVPLEFFNYIAHASYADFLRLEGKREEAQVEEAVAQNYLAIELEKIDVRNNNNSINHKFSTYVNRQSR